MRVLDDVVRDGAQDQLGNRSVCAGSYDDQLRVTRVIENRLSRWAFDDDSLDLVGTFAGHCFDGLAQARHCGLVDRSRIDRRDDAGTGDRHDGDSRPRVDGTHTSPSNHRLVQREPERLLAQVAVVDANNDHEITFSQAYSRRHGRMRRT